MLAPQGPGRAQGGGANPPQAKSSAPLQSVAGGHALVRGPSPRTCCKQFPSTPNSPQVLRRATLHGRRRVMPTAADMGSFPPPFSPSPKAALGILASRRWAARRRGPAMAGSRRARLNPTVAMVPARMGGWGGSGREGRGRDSSLVFCCATGFMSAWAF